MHGPPLRPPPPPLEEAADTVTGAGGVTNRVVDAVVVPSVLPQEISKVRVVGDEAVKGPTVSEPVTDLFPAHELPATHSVAFDDVHESVAVLPLTTAVGLTEKTPMVVVATVVVPVSLSKLMTEISDGLTPFQLISTLVIAPRRILYVILPSTIVSSTPVTNTVWGIFQFDGRKSTDDTATVPSLVSELDIGIETAASGAESRTTVNDADDAYSVVDIPPVGIFTETVPVAVPPGGLTTRETEDVVVPAVFAQDKLNGVVVSDVTLNGPTD